jgi:IS5 family transposase
MEELLAQSNEATNRAHVIKPSSVQRVIVDTTVMEKAAAYPTDSALLERSGKHLVKTARQWSLNLRQNYFREAPRLVQQIARYAHANQFRRMRADLRALHVRDEFIAISLDRWVKSLCPIASCSTTYFPEVECIAKKGILITENK